jgi:hypothetical protein
VVVESDDFSMDGGFGISNSIGRDTHTMLTIVGLGVGILGMYQSNMDPEIALVLTSIIGTRSALERISGRMLSMCPDWLGSWWVN